jgi:hypothetical protein
MKFCIFLLMIICFHIAYANSNFDIFQTWTDIKVPGYIPPNDSYPWPFFTISPDSTVSAFLIVYFANDGGAWYEGRVTKVAGDTLTIHINTKYESSWKTMIKKEADPYEEEWVFRYDHDSKHLIATSVVGDDDWKRMSVEQTFRATVDDSYRSLITEPRTFIYNLTFGDLKIPVTVYYDHFTNFGSGRLEKIGFFYDGKDHIIEIKPYPFYDEEHFTRRSVLTARSFDFDGNMGLEIYRLPGAVRAWWDRYVYNPIEKRFNFHEELSSYQRIYMYEEDQTLSGFASWGAAGHESPSFRWIDGVLTKFQISVLDWMVSDLLIIFDESTLTDDGSWFEESVLKRVNDYFVLSRTEGHTGYRGSRMLWASKESHDFLLDLLERAHSLTPEGERVLQIFKNQIESMDELSDWETKLYDSFREYIE